jgi:hypothetical protein
MVHQQAFGGYLLGRIANPVYKAYFDGSCGPRNPGGTAALVIQQMLGRWKIKAGIYEPFAQRAKVLTSEFSNIGGQWIPRGQNTIADGLSNAHLGAEKKQYWNTGE